MSFETDLDKYLTTPPDDSSCYYETVYDAIPETVLSQDDFEKYSGILDQIIDVCVYAYNPIITPKECANFITIMLKCNLIKGIGTELDGYVVDLYKKLNRSGK